MELISLKHLELKAIAWSSKESHHHYLSKGKLTKMQNTAWLLGQKCSKKVTINIHQLTSKLNVLKPNLLP